MGREPRPGAYAMSRGHTLDLRWNALLREFRRSGLTQAALCERRGISIPSFRKHLYRVPRPTPPPPPPSPPHPPPPPQPPELLLGNGRRIAIAPGFDPHPLRQLIAVVEEPP